MADYREIMRLDSLNYSQRSIAQAAGCSRNTVEKVLRTAKVKGVQWPLEDDVANRELEELLFPEKYRSANMYAEPDYPYIHRELAKPGVTMALLWEEYCRKCHESGETPYMSTQFGDKYRKWARVTKATMRIQRKPGDAIQVDWAGDTTPVYDPVTGEQRPAYLFVAVLPCSCYTYAEACEDMKTENWLTCHVHAFSYFGGVARLLIPDNCKTATTSNTRYETVLNRIYQELAEYYFLPPPQQSGEHFLPQSHVPALYDAAALRFLAHTDFESVRHSFSVLSGGRCFVALQYTALGEGAN